MKNEIKVNGEVVDWRAKGFKVHEPCGHPIVDNEGCPMCMLSQILLLAKAIQKALDRGMRHHNEFCDAILPGPDLGPSTKPCSCGKAELEHALAKKPKP